MAATEDAQHPETVNAQTGQAASATTRASRSRRQRSAVLQTTGHLLSASGRSASMQTLRTDANCSGAAIGRVQQRRRLLLRVAGKLRRLWHLHDRCGGQTVMLMLVVLLLLLRLTEGRRGCGVRQRLMMLLAMLMMNGEIVEGLNDLLECGGGMDGVCGGRSMIVHKRNEIKF